MFRAKLTFIPEKLRCYLDESGIDDNEVYHYAWGPKGERIYGLKMGYKNKRLSIISTLNQGKVQAPFVFEGYCNTEIICFYIEKILIPTLMPGQVIIMDNASFHKSRKIEQLIEEAGCRLLYLPTYSPDLNPIEHFWSPIKSYMRKALPKNNYDLFEAAKVAFNNVNTYM